MRSIAIAICLCVSVCSFVAAGINDADIIARGDANHDGSVNISDASYIFSYLYQGGPAPPCLNEADANHDGSVAQSDGIYILNWLYHGGSAPPAPGPFNTTCTTSSSPNPGCAIGC